MEAEIPRPGHHLQRPHALPSRLLGDERLAREVGAGSERAFAMLFQRYHQQLYRYCRGLTGSDQDAEDALQTTFTKALVALRVGRRNSPLRPWLYRIAHNESITVIRGRTSAVAELAADLPASRQVIDSVEERERLAMLLADLAELPEQQRGALVMRELSGLSHEEIAVALQVSAGAAKQSILEARRSLMEFAEGRAMICEEVQRIISDDDRRSLRSRRVRAHLRDCAVCSAFAEAIPRRRADMLALWPMLPATGSAGLLAKIMGGTGSGHGGGGAGLAAGTAAKGLGATISLKAATAAGVAVVATATVGAVAVLHRATPATPPVSAAHSGAVTQRGASAHGQFGSHGAAGAVHGAARHHGLGGRPQRPAAGNSTRAGNHGASRGATTPLTNGQGHGPATAPGQSQSHGHSSPARSATASQHGSSHSAHGKPIKVSPPVTRRRTGRKRGISRVKHRSTKPLKLRTRSGGRATAGTPAGGSHKSGSGSGSGNAKTVTTTTSTSSVTQTGTTTTTGTTGNGGNGNGGSGQGGSASSTGGQSTAQTGTAGTTSPSGSSSNKSSK